LEVEKMYKYIVFSCLIGNGDAHLKNFALQYTPDMSNIFVSPPFDITHTLIYPTINNKMALNICKSKEFPDCEHLIKLANQGHIIIRNAQEIVESLAQGIIEYVSSSQEALLLSGLKESILAGIDKVMTATYNSKSYRHDKKKKFE
ncbi:MAG: HipA domain-containing protein, partial [Pseudoalteromonas rhizosphaerae]|uniref:HipA domain-containing protein n=1 Tax=Pseudoalteromonas rhizosphaerae TaxID=2518973 RepID=UPI003C77CC4F